MEQEQYTRDQLSEDADIKRARHGAYAGLVFAAMMGLGLAVALAGHDPAGEEIPGEEYIGFVVGVGFGFALTLFLSWRVWMLKGSISSIVLLLLFLFEMLFKFTSGTMKGYFVPVYLWMLYAFGQGIAASWSLRKRNKAQAEPAT